VSYDSVRLEAAPKLTAHLVDSIGSALECRSAKVANESNATTR
jgi:hypothetical protein